MSQHLSVEIFGNTFNKARHLSRYLAQVVKESQLAGRTGFHRTNFYQ
jgi:hypothetical protein